MGTIGDAACWTALRVRGLLMPVAVALAHCRLDTFHNFLRGDIEAELRFFQNPMSISRALREDRQQYAIYKEISETGLIPAAFLLHGPDTAVLAGFWGLMREAFDADGYVSRDVLEVLAAEVSELVGCPLCVSVHAAFMDGMGITGPAEYYGQPAELRRCGLLAEPYRRLVDWLATYPREDFDATLLDSEFDPMAKAELLGTAFAFHYIGGIYPSIMPGSDFIEVFMRCTGLGRYQSSPRIRNRVYRMAVQWIGYSMRRHRPSGESVTLQILKNSNLDLDLTEDTLWALPNPHISTAVAGFLAATERLASEHLSRATLESVHNYVHGRWDGVEDPGETDAQWARDVAEDSGLGSQAERVATELGLLVALSPKQLSTAQGMRLLGSFVEISMTDDADDPDPALLAILSWSRLQATRRFVARLAGA